MEYTQSTERPLPLRQADDDTWEVENSPDQWTRCETKEDAMTISNAPLILEKSFKVVYPDENVAAELEATAAVLEQYNIGFGSRFFRVRAKVVRCEDIDN